MTARPRIAFFKEIDKHDLPLVGGKGANLGEMTQAGFPVPYGFAVTVESYDEFLQENDLLVKISEILKGLDASDSAALLHAANKVQKLIVSSKMPATVAKDTIAAYRKLSGHFNKALVAVRSSATAEDLPGASFAGQ